MTAWRRARAWAPAAIALAGVAALGWSQLHPVTPASKPSVPSEPQLSDEARTLLGELEVGDQIMGWTVQALDGPTDGMLRIDVGRDRVRFALMVATIGSRPQAPPLQTQRYAIFYGHAHPPETSLPDGTIRATTHALARRIRAHELELEVPGM
jgi:hypothetical protein